MKKILFIMIALGMISGAKASHIAAVDLTYTSMGGNDYLVTLSFYRDCSGIAEPTTITLNCSSSCGNFNFTLNKISPPNGDEVTTVCPGQATTCSGGTIYGIRKWVYQGQVTLAPCSDWTLSYTLCCRNPSNTISNPTSADMYIEARLNNVAAPGNTAPTFSYIPVIIIFNGAYYCSNHGTIEPDGDSLSYSLVTPYDNGPNGPDTNVVYLSGYSAQQPLPSNPPVTMDPYTGSMCMTPTANLTTVYAILVEEWRMINGNYVNIGSVMRDMQLTVVTGNNQLPKLSGINPAATFYNPADTIYEINSGNSGDTVQFNIFSFDGDIPAQNLTMTWNGGIPGATFTVTGNGTTNPVGHFSWVPTINDLSPIPHFFSVTVVDNACPYTGVQTYWYRVLVNGNLVTLLPDLNATAICMGDIYTLTAQADNSVTSYSWTINGNPVTPANDTTLIINSNLLGPGTYTVLITVDDGDPITWPGLDQQIITIMPLPASFLGPDEDFCSGTQYEIIGGFFAGYLWSTGATTPNLTVSSGGQYSVTVTDAAGCVGADTIVLTQVPCIELSGKVYADQNQNCVYDMGDILFAGVPVHLYKNGQFDELRYTDINGEYAFHAPTGHTYTVEADISGFIGYTFTCPPGGVYPGLTLQNTSLDFGIYCGGNGFDLWAYATGWGFRPGFNASICIHAGSNGCTSPAAQIILVLDPLLHFQYSNPAPSYVSGDTLIWSVSNLSPNNGFYVCAYVLTDPNAVIGDSVFGNLFISPVYGDVNRANNFDNNLWPVLNSWDPNIKEVAPSGLQPGGLIAPGTKLTYTVLFQNTGNDTAYDVTIIDVLDDNLDATTFQFIASSHNVVTSIQQGNTLRFDFYNIMLPDSNTNEPASHGFVLFSIKPVSFLDEGTEIENTAYIYFDNNPPVATNTVLNTISHIAVVPGIQQGNIRIYPNPANDAVMVELENNAHESVTLEIFNLQGQKVLQQQLQNPVNMVNISGLHPGVFIVRIAGQDGNWLTKLVKY